MMENHMKKTMYSKPIYLVLAGVMILVLAGCSSDGPVLPGGNKPQEVISELSREDLGDFPLEELAELAAGNSAFALDLYQQLASQEGNLFYSPYSISSALAMTYAGAEGNTAEEMAAVLHFLENEDQLHAGFNALDQYLEGLAEMDIPEDQGDPFQLNIANSIWGQKDFSFEEQFLNTLAVNYGAGLRLLDYIQAPEESRQTINQWVSDQTKKKIQDLIPEGAITTDTRLVLSNAIYFKATWMETFEESLTEDSIFYGLDGEEIDVEMMSTGSDASYAYYQGDGFQVVALPYVGGQVSMLVIIPDEGTFKEFEAGFSSEQLDEIVSKMTYSPIALKFPKFEFESEISLAQTLAAMGMPEAVSTAADFSGMTGDKDLFISDVFHKAFVGVDEEGTEAAAATAVIMSLTSAPMDPLQLTVDRPFLFAIREHQTNSILFMGRLVSP
jgi:serpin B